VAIAPAWRSSLNIDVEAADNFVVRAKVEEQQRVWGQVSAHDSTPKDYDLHFIDFASGMGSSRNRVFVIN
jgi:hypothetical protein